MADKLIRAGIVLTGDAAGAVQAFAQTRREAETLKSKFAEAQAEVDRLARQLKAFQSVGAQPLGVTRQFEQAKATAQALKAQLDATAVSLERNRQAIAQFGLNSTSLNADLAQLAQRQNPAAQRLTAGLSEAGRFAQDIGAQVTAGMSRAGAAADAARRKAQELEEAARRGTVNFAELGLTIGRQLAGLAGVGLGVGTVQITIRTADAYQLVAQRLSLVTSGAANLSQVQRELFESAQRTRLGFIDLADAYARIARNAKQVGIEQDRLLRINEAIAKASSISGGSTESINGSLIQLAQGIASNRLGGDELRSVLEQNTRLAQAIADGLGVSIGELRQLGEDGQLTAERVLGAIEKSASRLDAEFGRLEITGGQAWTVLTNSAGRYIDAQNQAMNGTRSLAAMLVGTAKVLDLAAEGADAPRVFLERQLAAEKLQVEIARQAGFQDALRKLFALYDNGTLGVESYRLAVAQLIETQAAVERFASGAEQLPKATQAFLDVQSRLTGVNQNFTRDLNTLFDAYRKGVVPVERYRELVTRLIETDTEAGKSAKAAADARLKAQRDLVEKSIGDQQRLVEATRKAFEDSLADAKRFAKQAADLREQAADVQRAASSRAADRRNQSLDPEERDGRNAIRASILIDQANAATRQSGAAAAGGDAETALKLAERAKKLAEEAGQFADKVTDDSRAASLIEQAGSAAAKAIEAAAKLADAQAANAKATADAQAQTLAQLEERLKALQAAAASVPVKLETDEAQAQFEALRALFSQGFTVPLRTAANEPQGFASGGLLRGPGSGTSDSLLARVSNGEFVQRAAAVEHYGVAFMERLNRLQVPRFAAGGLVDRVRVREPAAVGGATTINLTLPGAGTFAVSAEAAVAEDLTRAVQRAALKRGRR